TLTENGFVFNQYSLPNNPEEIKIFQKLLCPNVETLSSTVKTSNSVLSKIAVKKIRGEKDSILNFYPSIQEYGGVATLHQVEEVIRPKIENLVTEIDPFISELMNNIPMMMFDSNLLND